MKLTIAIVFTLAFAIIGIGFRVSGKINSAALTAILTFALFGGIIITVHDRWTKFKAGEYEVEVARGEINEAKVAAIDEIKKEVEAQKESIVLLTKTANQVNEKLEDTITKVANHQESITHLVETADEAEKRLQKALEMAAPPQLSLLSKEINKTEYGYYVVLRFRSSKNQPLGMIFFVAKIIGDSNTKIVDFWPTGMFSHGKDSKKISDDGKEARLTYALIGSISPQVELKTSDTCKVEISGSHELAPFILEVK